MHTVEIIFIALGLAMDASAVALVASCAGYASNKRAIFRLSFHFALFQSLMPILGWFVGYHFVHYLRGLDHWIAFIILAIIGGRMFLAGNKDNLEKFEKDPSRGLSLIFLSVATSIDALAIGLTISMLEISIWYPSLIIGIVTATCALIAIVIGQRLGIMFGKKMEKIGGIILIAIGLQILISHIIDHG